MASSDTVSSITNSNLLNGPKITIAKGSGGNFPTSFLQVRLY